MLVFVTAVKHPDNSESYDGVWRLLNNTLYSVCNQDNSDFRVIVVCDQKLPLFHHQELIHKYTDFIEVNFPSHGDDVIERFNALGNLSHPIDAPKWWKQWSLDRKKPREPKRRKFFRQLGKLAGLDFKNPNRPRYMSAPEIHLMANYTLNRGSKQLIGILAAKKHDPDYVLMLDADDYVGNDIASYVNAHPNENGWIMTQGYKLAGNLIAPMYAKNSFCGTGNIVSYKLLLADIPEGLSETSTQDELFRLVNSEFLVTLARHGKLRNYYKKKGYEFIDYPKRSAIHLLGHNDSNDFQRRRLRKESLSLRLEEAQKYGVFLPVTEDLALYFGVLSTGEAKEFARLANTSATKTQKMSRKSKKSSLIIRTRSENVMKKVGYSAELNQASLIYQRASMYLTNAPLYPSSIQYNLTISEKKKFIWFRVAKVGSRTILDVFRQANIELDAEHPYDIYYPINVYQGYFKFAFVRNPWDRIVSCWRDKVIRGGRFQSVGGDRTFEDFVDYVALNEDLLYGNPHLRLQSRLVDLNHIDYLGRFETYAEDLRAVMKILGIEASIKRKNATKRKADYREYYTDRTREKVAKLYERDIKIFGYKF